MAMLGRQFNRLLKQVNSRIRGSGQNIRFNIDKQQSNPRYDRNNDKNVQYKGVQCFECGGYGHIRTECATLLKKQKKGMLVSWSDDEDGDGEGDAAKIVTALTGRVIPLCNSSDKDLAGREIVVPDYDDTDMSKLLAEHDEIINQLQYKRSNHSSKVADLNHKVISVKSHLNNASQQVMMMSAGTDVFTKSLDGQTIEEPNDIEHTHEPLINEHKISNYVQSLDQHEIDKSVNSVEKLNFVTSSSTVDNPGKMLEHPSEPLLTKPEKESSTWKCPPNNLQGHKNLLCFNLYKTPELYQSRSVESETYKERKSKCVGLMIHTSPATSDEKG
jgi:hypothetical protein